MYFCGVTAGLVGLLLSCWSRQGEFTADGGADWANLLVHVAGGAGAALAWQGGKSARSWWFLAAASALLGFARPALGPAWWVVGAACCLGAAARSGWVGFLRPVRFKSPAARRWSDWATAFTSLAWLVLGVQATLDGRTGSPLLVLAALVSGAALQRLGLGREPPEDAASWAEVAAPWVAYAFSAAPWWWWNSVPWDANRATWGALAALPFLACGLAALRIEFAADSPPRCLPAAGDAARPLAAWQAGVSLAWLAGLAGAVALWPLDWRPHPCSFSTWWIGAALVAAVYFMLGLLDWQAARQRLAEWAPRALLAAGCLHSASYLIEATPRLGGVDAFYFWCYGRDMAWGEPVSPDAYRYFPGMYMLLRNVFSIAGASLFTAQATQAVLLAGNALLAGWLVWRSARTVAGAALAALWCWVLLTRFQGLQGGVELLATLPLLAGLAYWNGRPLNGRRGLRDAVVLGISVGLALLCKQQAGLLSLGAAGLLLQRVDSVAARRPAWTALLAMPLAAVGVVLAGLLLEGMTANTNPPAGPLTPLREGLAMAANYPGQGSPWSNLYVLLRTDETAACAMGLLLLGAAWSFQRRPDEQATRMLLWLAVATLASLAQFLSRPYGHYALLAAPLLSAGVVIWGANCWRSWRARAPGSSSWRLLLATAAALPVCYVTTDVRAMTPWRWNARHVSQLWADDEQAASDLLIVQRWVRRQDRAYVAPSRRAELYFRLELLAAGQHGYRFETPRTDGRPWRSGQWVLIVRDGLDESDRRWWPAARLEAIREDLREAGFRQVTILPTLELYQQPDSP